MAIGIEQNFIIYSPQFWGGVVETLQQYTDAFNESSNNSLRLVTRAIMGDYERESFMKSTANLISRRDPTSVASVTDNMLTEGEFLGIKVNKRIGPVAQTLDSFKKVALDPGEFSVILGQQAGKAIAVDYINNAIGAVYAGILTNAALKYDNSTQTLTTLNNTALVNGIALFGDAASRITCWVMHSKTYFDLMRQSIADKVFEVANITIYQGTVATLNRPTVVLDSPSLVTSVTNGSVVSPRYAVLGLTENAVEVAESEERSIISQPVTGLQNLVMRIQGEYAYNVRVKGMAWNVTNAGINPTDTALATSANWTQVVTDNKSMPGVVIITT
jgi:hypothetical protein